jgi:hypothetical protein
MMAGLRLVRDNSLVTLFRGSYLLDIEVRENTFRMMTTILTIQKDKVKKVHLEQFIKELIFNVRELSVGEFMITWSSLCKSYGDFAGLSEVFCIFLKHSTRL